MLRGAEETVPADLRRLVRWCAGGGKEIPARLEELAYKSQVPIALVADAIHPGQGLCLMHNGNAV